MPTRSTVPIVGIGASAGGLEALLAMVGHIGLRTGAAYVIVQHLSPTQKSILHELLQDHVDVPVAQIRDGDPILPDHIYVVPPGMVCDIRDDRLHLTARSPEEAPHRPIDMFFDAMARERGRDAYCVVLSGTGNDGSSGLRTVKANGGYAFVQESTGARFPGMPDSAISTGLVDFILPIERIATQLAEIINHRQRLSRDSIAPDIKLAIEKALPRFTKLLSDRVGHDFSSYKPGTLIRRIERRMTMLRLTNVDDFLDILADESEAHLLSQEFLIGVTQFFRDPAAFDALRQTVIPTLLDTTDAALRVWVPGCSTGEEAYSIAILFLEEMAARRDRRVLQVFGTDIDTAALTAARYGRFSTGAVSSLDPALLDKYFVEELDEYRAVPRLREACIFAPHNIIQDPPFSRIDLISCRNLLIYLSSDLQKQVIPRFHFALRDRGYLFLGPSEGLSGEDNLFSFVDKPNRIFEKNDTARTSYSALLEMPRRALTQVTTLPRAPQPVSISRELSREAGVEREFLRNHAAPFALLSALGEVVYLSQRMTTLVQPSSGTPSTSIDAFLMPDLRMPVRSALQRCVESGEAQSEENVVVPADGGPRIFDIRIGPAGGDYILTVTEARAIEAGRIGDVLERREAIDRDILETEVVQLRKQLARTLQETETSGEELKSFNEELMSMNEELQSSNEELETSREELQSINEELETVNAELQENNRQLTRANSDLKNLFESTDLAALFLDRDFCVRNFTPSVTKLFGIRIRDIGRPISDLASRIEYPELQEDAERVDETQTSLEREVVIQATQETYILRIKPYRTTDNLLDGYVLSFVDITQRKNYEVTLKRNERALERQYAELENLYDTTPVGLALVDSEMRWVRINDTLARINGFPAEDHIGKSFMELLPELAETLAPPYREVFETGKPVQGLEIVGQTHASPGETRHWIGDFYPVWQGRDVFAVGVCVREVTEQARMVERIRTQNTQQKTLLAELQHRVKNTLATVSSISKLLLQGIQNPSEYQSRLEERLAAMSRTHDLLTDGDWKLTTYSQILANETLPYPQGERVTMRGPDLPLVPRIATSLGMATHELVTNAVKYGALSVDAGRVEVRTIHDASGDDNRAHIIWKELGGPAIATPPDRQGFGSIVLQRVLKSDLNATIAVDYEPDGLRYEIIFDLEETI
ncbi:chemotaxis protein CheB [Loktanella atrilutea]|nr:chemotaxis protein CheB [Loktanella atrilutea]